MVRGVSSEKECRPTTLSGEGGRKMERGLDYFTIQKMKESIGDKIERDKRSVAMKLRERVRRDK